MGTCQSCLWKTSANFLFEVLCTCVNYCGAGGCIAANSLPAFADASFENDGMTHRDTAIGKEQTSGSPDVKIASLDAEVLHNDSFWRSG